MFSLKHVNQYLNQPSLIPFSRDQSLHKNQDQRSNRLHKALAIAFMRNVRGNAHEIEMFLFMTFVRIRRRRVLHDGKLHKNAITIDIRVRVCLKLKAINTSRLHRVNTLEISSRERHCANLLCCYT